MRAARASGAPLVPQKRCAVYTRKSTEEGLDQEYNSLEAQRDAGLAYIASQRHEGWIPVEDGYDDPGYSGGNMERPALKRLLADIDAGRVHIVVVYKIDRLTRSLADFARLVEAFDRRGVSFVSVTQQFNTTSSMGRLTLNVLLSFAQFEREVTGERIRDKIAASKAKGMWMGGMPPLGYDVRERRLVVNEHEADLVRDIFRRFAEHGSAARLMRELAIEGRTTKVWVTQTGNRREGRTIDQAYLGKLLRNRLYLGETVHKGASYVGQHEAIVSRAAWDAVQAVLDQRRKGPRQRPSANPSLLAGLLFAPDGQRMLLTYTDKKNGKRYRYYAPYLYKRRSAGVTAQRGVSCIGLLPAAEIETAVLQQIHAALRQPEMLVAVWKAAQAWEAGRDINEPQAVVALQRMALVWEQLFPAEQQRIARLLIERVQLHDGGLDIVWREDGWFAFGPEIGRHPFVEEQKMRAEEGEVA
ncbi:recombinase family protein [Eleftheria terrae]|uniref:recombinase family protein n=1 Tax=Eleftheria terrae TaxID=1597781 RepID=UPI00263B572D|nr:recombinase family protein [Eleftheria terrae]WKB55984.1 recombinase family protein [Eleftheria terrae]